jgi:hypothetical protein
MPKHWSWPDRPAANYFFSSVVVVVVVPAAGAEASAAGAAAASVVAGAAASVVAGAIAVVSVVVVVEVEVSVPAAGVSMVVSSVFFDSHEVRPAVRARPRAATLNRLFILRVILRMG